jgi:hypothetical protein
MLPGLDEAVPGLLPDFCGCAAAVDVGREPFCVLAAGLVGPFALGGLVPFALDFEVACLLMLYLVLS